MESEIKAKRNRAGNQDENESITNISTKRKGEEENCSNKKLKSVSEETLDETNQEKKLFRDTSCCINIANFPVSWTYFDITDFLGNEIPGLSKYSINMLSDDQSKFSGKIQLRLRNAEECEKYKEILLMKKVDGIKLDVDIDAEENKANGTSQSSKSSDKACSRPQIDPDDDPSGLYGLKLEFLQKLDIKPPIQNRVHVTGFRCDKVELKEVMELAGQVVNCIVVYTEGKYAKVLYSHPLEAVQAVSMLNGQKLYGHRLCVKMDESARNTIILPKGLTTVGDGLGKYGKPLRDVAKHYERYLKGLSSSVDTSVFRDPSEIGDDPLPKIEIDECQIKCVEELKDGNRDQASPSRENRTSDNSSPESEATERKIQRQPTPPGSYIPRVLNSGNNSNFKSSNSQSFRPHSSMSGNVNFGLRGHASPGPRMPGPDGPRPRFPMHPNNSPMSRPCGPMNNGYSGSYGPNVRMTGPNGPMFGPPNSGPPGTGPMNGPFNNSFPGPNPRFQGPGSMPPMPQGPYGYDTSMEDSNATVEFRNLPPSMTFGTLTEKASMCGQIVSLQFTSPGYAIVQFAQPMQARMCCDKFNNTNCEGYVVRVEFI